VISMMKHVFLSAAIAVSLSSPADAQVPEGFTTYLLGFMTRATGQLPAGRSMQELQKAHLANLDAMWKEGLLVASGPIADKSDLRGVVIFRGDQRSAVEARVADDPLIKAGFLKIELGPWMGPIGIGDEYRKWAAANPGATDKMRTYQLVLLKTAWGAGQMTREEQRGHMVNMDAMAKAGKLIAAGPVLEGSDLTGIFVFTVDAAEADALTASDPAVKAGKLVAERHPWMVAEGVLPAGFKVPVP
jgi:uncharacterized protein YciI